MRDIIFLVIMGLCGSICIYIGYLIWIKEKINMIHDYHYTKVKESDKKAYTSIMGKGMIVIGAGTVLSGIVEAFIQSGKGGTVFGISFVLGISMIIYAQIKYNHGLF